MILAQNGDNQYAAAITGKWRNAQYGLTFQFNPDGTFVMVDEGEEARRAAQGEPWTNNESVATTYTVTAAAINMMMVVNGKSHKIRMPYKILDPDTLRIRLWFMTCKLSRIEKEK
jgi:hypothetical protein